MSKHAGPKSGLSKCFDVHDAMLLQSRSRRPGILFTQYQFMLLGMNQIKRARNILSVLNGHQQ